MSYKDILHQITPVEDVVLEMETSIIPRGTELIVSMASLYKSYSVYGSITFPATPKGLSLMSQWLTNNESILSKESYSKIKSYLAHKTEPS